MTIHAISTIQADGLYSKSVRCDSAQDWDPGSFIDALAKMANIPGSCPAWEQQMASDFLNYLYAHGGSIPSQDQAEQLFTQFLSQNFPPPADCDVWMNYGITEQDLQSFCDTVNQEASPASLNFSPPAESSLPNCTWNDNLYAQMVKVLAGLTGDKQTAGQIFLSAIRSLGPNGVLLNGGYQTVIDNIFTDPNFFQKYPGLNNPHAASNDIYDVLENYVQPVFNNAYPSGVTPIAYFPDIPGLEAYLEIGFNSVNVTPYMQAQLLQAAQGAWNSQGDIYKAMQQTFSSMNDNAFRGSTPHPYYQTVEYLEGLFQVPAKPMQPQLFQIWNKMDSLPAGSPAADMWQDLFAEVSMYYKNGSISDVQNDYNTNIFANNDAFMKYYNVDNDEIYDLLNTIYGRPLLPMLSQADLQYRQVMLYRDSLPKGSADYDLMDELSQALYQAGSHPTDSQQQDFYQFAMSMVSQPGSEFYQSSSATQQVFLSCCNGSFLITLGYMQAYIANWADNHPAAYNQDFASTLQSVIAGYASSTSTPSLADLQNYIDEYYGDNDYCFIYQGLAPQDVDSFFAHFGLQDPYTYGPVDTAYSSANQAYSNLPDPTSGDDIAYNGDGSDANPGLFQLLCECQQGAISMNDVKNWIKQFEASQYWSEVSQETADEFNAILNS